MLINHHYQQLVRRKTRNLELCFGTNVRTNQAKIEKISISREILLGFLRSLVSAIRCANKINRRREERPIGSCSVKMLRDGHGPTAARARSRAACSGGERARQSDSTYAQRVDMMSRIVTHNRMGDGSLENTTCARGIYRAKTNQGRGKSRLFSRFSSVSPVH